MSRAQGRRRICTRSYRGPGASQRSSRRPAPERAPSQTTRVLFTWLEARDDGTDDSDREHPGILSRAIALTPEDANGTDHPDEEEWCRERKADGGFVRGIARHSSLQSICRSVIKMAV